MKTCFAGDMFLGGDLLNLDATNVVDSKQFFAADRRIVNLEQSISDKTNVEDKSTLFTGSDALTRARHLRIDAVNLAHNHIQDSGLHGISETLGHLTNAGIGSFGAGNTLDKAKRGYWLTEEIAVFGYCDYDKPYLKQVVVAADNSPGVNPLRHENILSDLDALPTDKSAILYFHWGREHVWFPRHEDIELAKRLLEHEKVLLILGMHAHQAQGFVEHNGKRAYMCLGNFLFPNFHIAPPVQLFYPPSPKDVHNTTRQYHSVSKPTYKKWRAVNRTSVLVTYDTSTFATHHSYLRQDDNDPRVKELAGVSARLFGCWISALSLAYKLPAWIYLPLERSTSLVARQLWKIRIFIFRIRQDGLVGALKRVCGKLLNERAS